MALIIHVIGGLGIGGAETMLHRLVSSSAKGDFEHMVITLTKVSGMKHRFENIGINVEALNFRKYPVSDFFRLIQIIRKNRPAIVQTWLYHADLIGGIAARIAGVKNILWGIRSTDIKFSGFSSSILIRFCCSKLSKSIPRIIICAAESSKKTHIGLGYDAKRMVVIPNGFDCNWFKPMLNVRLETRNKLGLNANSIVVGFIGRYHRDKDPNNFLAAAKIISSMHQNLYFLMIGRDMNSGNKKLKSDITETGFSNRFFLLGERSDISFCLVAMDIFCLSSRTEGFPNVVGEAMAAGIPCVVTNVGDAGLIVGDTGISVPKSNSIELAKGLNTMLKLSNEKREELGKKARCRILSEFTLAQSNLRFENVYKKIIITKG